MNQKGIVVSSLIYALLMFFLLTMVGLLAVTWNRQNILSKLGEEANDIYSLEPTLLSDWDYVQALHAPSLDEGMIPVYYDSGVWKKANSNNESKQWYDYNNQKWANVVLVTSTKRDYYQNAAVGTAITENDVLAYLVWIPRYKYKLFNVSALASSPQVIDVIFEKKTDDKVIGTNNGEFLTHPAFTFGNTELSGIWVGKFELTGDSSIPTVKPDSLSLRSQTASGFFNIMRQFDATVDTSGTYGLTTNHDAHMMKNMEWGAVAYLTQSMYGQIDEVWINNSNTYITGCAADSASEAQYSGCKYTYTSTNGQKASTTGNVYGIYDTVGGVWEYLMGAQYNSDNSTIYVFDSGFSQSTLDSTNMSKYIDKYVYGTTSQDQTAYNRRKLGDATGEVRSWNSDYVWFIKNDDSWFCRGGQYFDGTGAGIFAFGTTSGIANIGRGSRLVISPL